MVRTDPADESLRIRYLKLLLPQNLADRGGWHVCSGSKCGHSKWHYAHPELLPCDISKDVRNPPRALAILGESPDRAKETDAAIRRVEINNDQTVASQETYANAIAEIGRAERAKVERKRKRAAILKLADRAGTDGRCRGPKRNVWLKDLAAVFGLGSNDRKKIMLRVHPDKHQDDKAMWSLLFDVVRSS